MTADPDATAAPRTGVSTSLSGLRTFLTADIRGYTRFTQQHGDEAAARLVARFAALVHEGVAARGGQVTELRGDEALAVFGSARQALHAALDMQARFVQQTDADPHAAAQGGHRAGCGRGRAGGGGLSGRRAQPCGAPVQPGWAGRGLH